MSALASNGDWSVAGSQAIWAFLRRTATSRCLVGVQLLRVAHVLLLRHVATSCRSTQGDMSTLASTYVWSRPTWARLRLIATSSSKAAIDLRFGRSEHSCRQLQWKQLTPGLTFTPNSMPAVSLPSIIRAEAFINRQLLALKLAKTQFFSDS